MALNPHLSNEAVNAELDALTALLNGGFINVYDGTQPATGDTALTTQVLLAIFTFGTPAFAAAIAGVAQANAVGSEANAPASGIATWYRMFKSNHSSPVMDGSVATLAANLILTSVNITIHDVIPLDAFTLTASKVMC